MSVNSSQDFIRGDARGQSRMLVTAGLSALVVLIIGVTVFSFVYPRATAPKGTDLHLVLPALGPGVENGSRVLLRGAEVGEVTSIDSSEPGVVHVDVVLDEHAAGSLTDAFELDYRPQNYFGVTAVNLVAKQGGSRLRDGQTIRREAAPDFTMSTMIERSSIVVDGTLTRDMVDSLDKVMRYANGLAPLIESGVILTDAVARTQRQMPSTLLSRMNDLAEEFPAFNVGAMNLLEAIGNNVLNRLPDGSRGVDEAYYDLMDRSLTVASTGLFGAIGTLLGSHATDLTPLVTSLKYVLDPMPNMIGDASMQKTRKAIDQLRNSFTGPGEAKTLQLRLLLDAMPAIAGPLSQMGAVAGPRSGGN
ncbi:mammalian cell entry protein [Gordonia paraffinivorans]|uniref:MlaD family protein n=1 Tax=Gordonia paraffinivorans TaxID=175628 RepID=UPI001C92ECF5|nr:MlaD family protein [Gordonia paraffinivorans]MBY4575755.1 mammalian cell entry protein [Gordonia paraffinivorans]